jgi:hypothetical protein
MAALNMFKILPPNAYVRQLGKAPTAALASGIRAISHSFIDSDYVV